jgi:hypothetical protein
VGREVAAQRPEHELEAEQARHAHRQASSVRSEPWLMTLL